MLAYSYRAYTTEQKYPSFNIGLSMIWYSRLNKQSLLGGGYQWLIKFWCINYILWELKRGKKLT